MRRFLRGLVILLMGCSGLGTVAVLFPLPVFLSSREQPLAARLLIFIILMVFFAGMFIGLGRILKKKGKEPSKETEQTGQNRPAHYSVAKQRQATPRNNRVGKSVPEASARKKQTLQQILEIKKKGPVQPGEVTEMKNKPSLSELTEQILADCREFGVDEAGISSFKKDVLLQRQGPCEGFAFTYDDNTGIYWLDFWEKGKPSGGIEDTDPLNFRFKFLQDFVKKHYSYKDPKDREEWETFLQKTYGKFRTTAGYQLSLESCKRLIPGFVEPNQTLAKDTENAVPRKGFIPWYGAAVPVEYEQVRESSIQELWTLGHNICKSCLIAEYKGLPYVLTGGNAEMWAQRKVFLMREKKTQHTVSLDELEEIYAVQFDVRYQGEWFPCIATIYTGMSVKPEGVFSCLIGDPECKTQLHTQHSSYMWGPGTVELNGSQIEAVRLWQSKPLTDLLLHDGA